jgi:hypothetical protein
LAVAETLSLDRQADAFNVLEKPPAQADHVAFIKLAPGNRVRRFSVLAHAQAASNRAVVSMLPPKHKGATTYMSLFPSIRVYSASRALVIAYMCPELMLPRVPQNPAMRRSTPLCLNSSKFEIFIGANMPEIFDRA